MSFCQNHLKKMCEMAFGLRPAKYCQKLDMCLIGTIQPDLIAEFIHHNNVFHNGHTYEQLGHLIRIMESREMYLKANYNYTEIINTIEKKVHVLEAHEKYLKEQNPKSYSVCSYAKSVARGELLMVAPPAPANYPTWVEEKNRGYLIGLEKNGSSKNPEPAKPDADNGTMKAM